MRSSIMYPVSLSSSYFFLLPLEISITHTKFSGVILLGEISCHILLDICFSFRVSDCFLYLYSILYILHLFAEKINSLYEISESQVAFSFFYPFSGGLNVTNLKIIEEGD